MGFETHSGGVFIVVLCFVILLEITVIDALDSSLDAGTALLVNYSAILNTDFYVMKVSLVQFYQW